jgi:type I site-specific restriction endonuclease
MMQIREEVNFTKGRSIVRGKLVTRGKAKRADYILYYKPNIPIAIIEAKDNNHSVGSGMQQALDYAVTLNIPFVFSSNGDGFVFHDRVEYVAQMRNGASLLRRFDCSVLVERGNEELSGSEIDFLCIAVSLTPTAYCSFAIMAMRDCQKT